MAYTTDIRTTSTGIFGRIAEFRRVLADRAARYSVYRTTLDELRQLSDRDLMDLGLSRSMIEDVAWKAANEA